MSHPSRYEIELMRDVSAADWVVETLEPWGRPVRLSSFMPAGFEAYARVFHPSYDGSSKETPSPKTWTELGADRGVVLRPDITFGEVAGLEGEGDADTLRHHHLAPAEGRLLETTCADLIQVLSRHTQTPERCWFGTDGWWTASSRTSFNLAPGPTRKELRRRRKEARKEERYLRSIPKVKGQGRDYILFRGPIGAACSFEPTQGHFATPSLWWPDDRAWTVVTEIEGLSTYVGGSRDTIDAIVGSPDLETIEVSREVPID